MSYVAPDHAKPNHTINRDAENDFVLTHFSVVCLRGKQTKLSEIGSYRWSSHLPTDGDD